MLPDTTEPPHPDEPTPPSCEGPVEDLQLGMCLLHAAGGDIWRRVILVERLTRHLVRLYYVDAGTSRVVHVDDAVLRRTPASEHYSQPRAIACSLYRVTHDDQEGFAWICALKAVRVVVMRSTKHHLSVNLYMSDVLVNDSLFDPREKLYELDRYEDTRVPECACPVRLSHYETYDEIYLQRVQLLPSLAAINDQLSEQVRLGGDNVSPWSKTLQPQVGDVCVATLSVVKSYRAIVVSKSPLTVQLVDYGRYHAVKLSDLSIIVSRQTSAPFLVAPIALRCRFTLKLHPVSGRLPAMVSEYLKSINRVFEVYFTTDAAPYYVNINDDRIRDQLYSCESKCVER